LEGYEEFDPYQPFAPQIEPVRTRARRQLADKLEAEREFDARAKQLPNPFEGVNLSDGHVGISEQKYLAWLEGESRPARRSKAKASADAKQPKAKPARRSKMTEEQILLAEKWQSEGSIVA